jgi:hypothetical protein
MVFSDIATFEQAHLRLRRLAYEEAARAAGEAQLRRSILS